MSDKIKGLILFAAGFALAAVLFTAQGGLAGHITDECIRTAPQVATYTATGGPKKLTITYNAPPCLLGWNFTVKAARTPDNTHFVVVYERP